VSIIESRRGDAPHRERSPAMKRKLLIALAVTLLLTGTLAGGVLAKNIRAENREKAQWAQAEAIFQAFQRLGSICNGQVTAFPQNAPYVVGPGPHTAVALEGPDSYTRTYNIVRDEWDPATPEATELILCMDRYEDIIEQCHYVPDGSTTSQSSSDIGTLRRTQYREELRLFSAQTGELLATETMLADEPDECPDTYTFYGSNTLSTLYGHRVSDSAIAAWLRPHVAP
jgi:hypothetical protein